MRVTRESLIRIAKETAQERAYNDKDIIAAYVTGSLLGEAEPMLGGTADIDLVLVHASTPMQGREFTKLTPDFHLDITHRPRSDFRTPRELRADPWLGWDLFAPLVVFEREKIFDFVQAALRAGFEFEGPALTLQRCRKLHLHGRQIWIDLSDIGEKAGPREMVKYLKALFHAGNAVAELSGPPIYERRFLLEFPARARQVEKGGMAVGMLGLLGAVSHFDPSVMQSWLEDWESSYMTASEISGVESRVHPARLNYYEKAIHSLLESDDPASALWPLLSTWSFAACVLPPERLHGWQAACESLGLLGKGFAEHVEGLDQYLDEVEILLDEIAAANGLETSSAY